MREILRDGFLAATVAFSPVSLSKDIPSYQDPQIRNYSIPGTVLLKENQEEAKPAYIWSLGRIIDYLYVSSLTNVSFKYQYQTALDSTKLYWGEQPNGFFPGFNPEVNPTVNQSRFTDDNIWIGLSLVRDYKYFGDKDNLKKAKRVFDLIESQWDKDSGGIYWQQQFPWTKDRQIGVVSNAAATIFSARLFQETGERKYLEFAQKAFDWTDSMKGENGLFNDHIERGVLDDTKWSYNQGLVIGALTLLSEELPKTYEISDATELANRSLDFYDSKGFSTQPPEFNAIFFQNILYLVGKTKDTRLLEKTVRSMQQLTVETENSKLIETAGIDHIKALHLLSPDKYLFLY